MVIRVHKSHRKGKFFPEEAEECPVPIDQLADVRRTVARKAKGGAYETVTDDWTAGAGERLFEDDSRWAGRTIFMIKGAPDPPPRPELVIEEEEYEPELPPLEAGDWDFELEDEAKELEDAQMNPAEAEEEEEGGEDEEGLPPLPVKTLWFMIPLVSKSSREVLEAIQQMYLELRRENLPLARLHSDCGREFKNKVLASWCLARDIAKTSTAGDDYRQNGRAERAIRGLKDRTRRPLHSAEMGGEYWPCAARYAVEKEKRTVLGSLPICRDLVRRCW